MSGPFVITPGMTPERTREIAAELDLRALPAEFYANPYPVYSLLRQTQPVKRMPDGSYFLTRYADLIQVYRDAQTFSSDKKVEFTPKYGAGSPTGNRFWPTLHRAGFTPRLLSPSSRR